MANTMKYTITGFDLSELEFLLASWEEPRFHAKQILTWLYQKGALDFNAMSDLPVALRQRLNNECVFGMLSLQDTRRSIDGTEKFLFSLADKGLIEAVSIPAEGRVTGCISSQVGCKFSCSFCASGRAGYTRDLTAGEIVEEALYLKFRSTAKQLTHLVFMGMGEPLDNYDNVLKAIRIINAKHGMNIGARRITISTCGMIPQIRRLAAEGMQFELSVSLHAADDTTRSRLMPVNKRYALRELIEACRAYQKNTGRQVTFEYILLEGINSSLADARKLGTILRGFDCKVNLIPANAPGVPGLEAPKKRDVLSFKDALAKSGIRATVRRSRGEDIEAACGQLRCRYQQRSEV
jgi:23S rRNA (adenine2503-C2)-methyltransferase